MERERALCAAQSYLGLEQVPPGGLLPSACLRIASHVFPPPDLHWAHSFCETLFDDLGIPEEQTLPPFYSTNWPDHASNEAKLLDFRGNRSVQVSSSRYSLSRYALYHLCRISLLEAKSSAHGFDEMRKRNANSPFITLKQIACESDVIKRCMWRKKVAL